MQAINMKVRLAGVRMYCTGLPEEVYQFAEYLAKRMSYTLVTPFGMVIEIAYARAEIAMGHRGPNGDKMPDYLIDRKSDVLAYAEDILLVIDELAPSDFAREVRSLCEDTFNWRSRKRIWKVDETCTSTLPLHVEAAINWWSQAIQHEQPTIEVGSMRLPALSKEFTEKEITAFRTVLAEQIMNDLNHTKTVILRVDYTPDASLTKAGEAAGIDEALALFVFPSKTTMYITEDEVRVTRKDIGMTTSTSIWKK